MTTIAPATGPAAATGTAAAAGPARRRGPGRLAAWLLLAPALAFFVLLFLLPLAVLLLVSVLDGNPMWGDPVAFTLRNYATLAGDPYYLEVMASTIELGLWVTLFSLVVGYPLALQLVRMTSAFWRTALLIAVLSPMMTGMVIRTYAWMTILADGGVVNSALIGAGVIEEPLALMYNMFGIIVAMVHIFVPFMVLSLIGVLGRIDPRLEQAARNLGASKPRAFVEVTLPLSVPGIVAGSLLVFALTISSYVTPVLMGGFAFLNLPILIYQQIASSFNPGMGAALGFVLLVLSLAVIAGYIKALGRLAGGPAALAGGAA